MQICKQEDKEAKFIQTIHKSDNSFLWKHWYQLNTDHEKGDFGYAIVLQADMLAKALISSSLFLHFLFLSLRSEPVPCKVSLLVLFSTHFQLRNEIQLYCSPQLKIILEIFWVSFGRIS